MADRVFRCHGCGRIPLAGTVCSEPCSRCGGVYVIEGDECGSCIEGFPRNECPKSKRWCGHHCNHVLTQDACDWCGGHYEEDEWVAQEPPAECGNCHGKGVHRTPSGQYDCLLCDGTGKEPPADGGDRG